MRAKQKFKLENICRIDIFSVESWSLTLKAWNNVTVTYILHSNLFSQIFCKFKKRKTVKRGGKLTSVWMENALCWRSLETQLMTSILSATAISFSRVSRAMNVPVRPIPALENRDRRNRINQFTHVQWSFVYFLGDGVLIQSSKYGVILWFGPMESGFWCKEGEKNTFSKRSTF